MLKMRLQNWIFQGGWKIWGVCYAVPMKTVGRCGFTLVEILMVSVIIGFLAVIGIPYVLNAYNHSKEQAKARNITDVEKAKRILTLPKGAKITGAMGLAGSSMDIQKNPVALSNLCAALSIESIDALTVDGDEISVGSLNRKASY